MQVPIHPVVCRVFSPDADAGGTIVLCINERSPFLFQLFFAIAAQNCSMRMYF